MSETAAVPEAPIVVAFPTINSGLVLRWYANEEGYARHEQLANAGREEARLNIDASYELQVAAEEVHRRLRDEVYSRPFGMADENAYRTVEALATHRGRIFSNELTPLHGADAHREPLTVTR